MKIFYKISLAALCLLFSLYTNGQDSLEVTITPKPMVDQPIQISVRGAVASGTDKLLIYFGFDTDSVARILIDSTVVEFDTTIYREFQGTEMLKFTLTPGYPDLEKLVEIEVKCPYPSCDLDPKMTDFVNWMRQSNYKECITSYYITKSRDAVTRHGTQYTPGIESFLDLRGVNQGDTLFINLYQIMPLDSGAVLRTLTGAHTVDCETSNFWTDFCPSPVPSDTGFLRRHFERTFGLPVRFNFEERYINYFDEFAVRDTIGDKINFEPDSMFEYGKQFDTTSIIYWAFDSINGYKINNVDGASSLRAYLNRHPGNHFWAGGFTHEWMHALGFPHAFVELAQGGRRKFQLDGVMTNSYFGLVRESIDPTDPLERYAMAPPSGRYIDSAYFPQAYSDLMVTQNSLGLDTCGGADLQLIGARIVDQTTQTLSFEVEYSNNSPMLIGFVGLGVFNDNTQGLPVREYNIEYIDTGQIYRDTFELNRSEFPSGTIVFKIDAQDFIPEDYETNNTSCEFQIPADPLKIVAPRREDEARFGWSVSLSDSFAVVGSPFHDYNDLDSFASNGGSVSVFKRDSLGWSFWQELFPANWTTNGNFGYDVDIYQNMIAVGSPGTTSVHIFDNQNGTWSESAKIEAAIPTLNSGFGLSLALWDSSLIVGAPYEDDAGHINNGAVYFFDLFGAGPWTQSSRVIAPDADAWDYFGHDVDLWNDRAVVGAVGDENGRVPGATTLNNAGSAYVLEQSGLGWSVLEKLVAQDRDSHDAFGWRVAIYDRSILVGANSADITLAGNTLANAGSVYAFARSLGGAWRKRGKLVAPNAKANDNFGSAVSIFNRRAIVGAGAYDMVGEVNAGSVYVVQRNNAFRWRKFVAQIDARDAQASDRFGLSVAMWDSCAVVGAPYEDHDQYGCNAKIDDGAAYILNCFPLQFNFSSPMQTQEQQDSSSDVSTTERGLSNPFVLSPNPAKTYLNITNPQGFDQEILIQNNLGQTISRQRVEAGKTLKISIIDLETGLYFVRNLQATQCQKLIVIRQ